MIATDPFAMWRVGQKVITLKPTRHGFVAGGTVGTIVRVDKPSWEERDCNWVTVEFPNQTMTFAFPLDRTIFKKLRLV